MKRSKISLTVFTFLMVMVYAFTIPAYKKHALEYRTAPGFAIYGNSSHLVNIPSQAALSSQGTLVASKTSGFTHQELNALAQEHCPAPNDILCLAEINTLDGVQDPATADSGFTITRDGTFE